MPLLYPKLRDRPQDFRLNGNSPLARGLVFAGLGRMPRQGLYWDSSFARNHGTLTGYTEAGNTPVDQWKWDSCLRRWVLGFDGVADYISSGLEQTTLGTAFTYMTWAYPTIASNYRGIAGPHESDHRGIVFFQYADGWTVSAGLGDSWASGVSPIPLPLNAWSHLCAVWDESSGSLVISVYLNGTFFASSTTAGKTLCRSSLGLWVGRAFEGGNRYFLGNVGDFIVMNGNGSGFASVFADPSNTDLRVGNVPLILSPRRVLFPVSSTRLFRRGLYMRAGARGVSA
jgi:hypothetical protein